MSRLNGRTGREIKFGCENFSRHWKKTKVGVECLGKSKYKSMFNWWAAQNSTINLRNFRCALGAIKNVV